MAVYQKLQNKIEANTSMIMFNCYWWNTLHKVFQRQHMLVQPYKLYIWMQQIPHRAMSCRVQENVQRRHEALNDCRAIMIMEVMAKGQLSMKTFLSLRLSASPAELTVFLPNDSMPVWTFKNVWLRLDSQYKKTRQAEKKQNSLFFHN